MAVQVEIKINYNRVHGLLIVNETKRDSGVNTYLWFSEGEGPNRKGAVEHDMSDGVLALVAKVSTAASQVQLELPS